MLNVTFAPVVVAVEELYDHSNGNYEIAYLWDGVQVTTAGGMYSRETFTVNATAEQIAAAAQWTKVNTEYKPTYSKHINGGRGGFTYVGCVVTLARSRKAPNKKPLFVRSFEEGYFDEKFRCEVVDKVVVFDDETQTEYTVSASCIKDVIKGTQKLPFWVN